MAKNPEKRAELVEHLSELRTRLVRSIIYLVVGTAVAWIFYDQLFTFLTKPMIATIKQIDTKFLLTSFPEAFMIRMQICMVAGLILMSPFVTYELWAFISPGLLPEEKKPLKLVAPLSVILFMAGVALCYIIMPVAFHWFASYIPPNAELRPNVQASVLFTLKMLLAFGILFELPVVLMMLAKIGIVDSKLLWENWRTAVVLVAVIAAVATPSGDAFTMLMAGIPVAILYFLGIGLVKLVERKPG